VQRGRVQVIEFEGRKWEYDEDKVTTKQGIEFFDAYGFTILGWQRAILPADPRAMQCCYWLMLQQNGVTDKPLKECDFAVIDFIAAYQASVTADEPAEAEPDPTGLPSSLTGSAESAESSTPAAVPPPPPVPPSATVWSPAA
jgi:hypothetical protein